MLITAEAYFGPRLHHLEATPDKWACAEALLDKVNALLDAARAAGVYEDWIDTDTGTQVSGKKGGSGDGGFRPSDATTGATKSNHKGAHAVDVFDPKDKLDNWLTDDILISFDLWREAPSATPTWCHLQDLAPGSGHRTFNP